MRVTETPLNGLFQIEPDVFGDARGKFVELYSQSRYETAGIVTLPFVQDNFSWSVRGTLRGLHYQMTKPQGKLVTVVKGAVYDVAVDIRQGSPSFGQWYGVELSDTNMRQLYVPPGFAHGFCVLSEEAGFLYKCTEAYQPADERGILWSDPVLAIAWPVSKPLLSPKDQAYKCLADMMTELPHGDSR